MAQYTYQTVTGPVEIEIDSHWAKMLATEDELKKITERKHVRADHKFAPGGPLSLEDIRYEGRWLTGHDSCIEAAEFAVDLENALTMLTDLQRRYFLLARVYNYNFAEIGRLDGKHRTTIQRLVESAEKKIFDKLYSI